MDSACENASEWNSLLRWARDERGPFLDPNSLTYQFSPQDPARSASARLAMKYQPQIPKYFALSIISKKMHSEFLKFKQENAEYQNSLQLDASYSQSGDFYDISGPVETKHIQPNYSGRMTRSQLQTNSNQSQVDLSGSSPQTFAGFSHATAANFKNQVGLQSALSNSIISGPPSSSLSGLNSQVTRSPIRPSNTPHQPRKGRPKRSGND